METKLRAFFYSKLGGFADKRVKNIKNDCPFSLSDYSHDVKDHATYVFLNVLDDSNLKISFSNNLIYNFPFTDNLMHFLKKYEIKQNAAQFTINFNANDKELLPMLRNEFNSYYSSSNNYVWVKERIIEAIDNLSNLLDEYKSK